MANNRHIETVEELQRKLQQCKKDIDAAERSKAEAEGSLRTLEHRLKEEFKLPSVEAAEKELQRIEGEVAQLTASISAGLKRLEGISDANGA